MKRPESFGPSLLQCVSAGFSGATGFESTRHYGEQLSLGTMIGQERPLMNVLPRLKLINPKIGEVMERG